MKNKIKNKNKEEKEEECTFGLTNTTVLGGQGQEEKAETFSVSKDYDVCQCCRKAPSKEV